MIRFPVSVSEARVAELITVRDGLPAGMNPVESVLAAAQLAIVDGNQNEAERLAVAAVESHTADALLQPPLLVSFVKTLIMVQRFDIIVGLLSMKYDPKCHVAIECNEQGLGIIKWDVSLPTSMRIALDKSVLDEKYIHASACWLVWIFPLFANYSSHTRKMTGSVFFNQWDAGLVPGLAMCDNREGYFLVPDNVFIPTWGYRNYKQHMAEHPVPWEKRHPIAFWRGSTTGHQADPAMGWRSMPRIKLCEIALDQPDTLDAGITNNRTIGDLEAIGIMKPLVRAVDFQNYRYQIDIDGNSNAWGGLFQKLTTGSPVLKVASPFGYRQWYYNRLQPWVNFVPVATDMSDLVDKIRWLQAHDDAAMEIGRRGQELAYSMEYQKEMDAANETITAAFRYFN